MRYSWFEYLLVGVSLVVTVSIGLYSGRGKTTLRDYMLGNGKMTILPVSLSVAATHLSGSAIVATAQEVYVYGMQTWFNAVMQITIGLLYAYIFLPVSYSVKSASTFEYFDRRYNSYVRKYASVMFALEMILHTGVSLYVPAVSLSQATGFAVFPIACFLSSLSWLYTAMGGFRAVTYADSFQAILFLGVVFVLFVVGGIYAGGVFEILNKGTTGYRTELFDLNPAYDLRYSVLISIGGGFLFVSRGYFSASLHQRVVAMSTYEEARKVTLWSALLTALCLIFTCCMGLEVYAYYAGCDPLLAGKEINSYATILPYFVGELSKSIPGLTGLFLSGVIAAGLSTTTSCWNTVACTLYEDIAVPLLPSKLSKGASIKVLNVILFSVALISTVCIPVVETIPSLLEATLTMKSFTACGSLSLHLVGTVLPWINAQGAVAGSLVSSVITTVIAVGSQRAKSKNLVEYVPKILTNAECVVNGTTMAALNQTITTGSIGYGLVTRSSPSVPWYFKMSMNIYYLPGFLLGLLASYLVSFLTGHEDLRKLDREMVIPLMRWALPERGSIDEEAEVPLKTSEKELDA